MKKDLEAQIFNAIAFKTVSELEPLLLELKNTDPNILQPQVKNAIRQLKIDVLICLATKAGVNIDLSDYPDKENEINAILKQKSTSIDDLNNQAARVREQNKQEPKHEAVEQNKLEPTVVVNDKQIYEFVSSAVTKAIKEKKTTLSKKDKENLTSEMTKALIKEDNGSVSSNIFSGDNQIFINILSNSIKSQEIILKDNSWGTFIKNVLKIFIGELEPIFKGASKLSKLKDSEAVAKEFIKSLESNQKDKAIKL